MIGPDRKSLPRQDRTNYGPAVWASLHEVFDRLPSVGRISKHRTLLLKIKSLTYQGEGHAERVTLPIVHSVCNNLLD